MFAKLRSYARVLNENRPFRWFMRACDVIIFAFLSYLVIWVIEAWYWRTIGAVLLLIWLLGMVGGAQRKGDAPGA
jgi:hypothetical protein